MTSVYVYGMIDTYEPKGEGEGGLLVTKHLNHWQGLIVLFLSILKAKTKKERAKKGIKNLNKGISKRISPL